MSPPAAQFRTPRPGRTIEARWFLWLNLPEDGHGDQHVYQGA
jgi:hypothetical protein